MLICELCIVTYFEMFIMNLSQSELDSLSWNWSSRLDTNYGVVNFVNN